MRGKFVLTAALVAAAILLVACGGDDDDETAKRQPPAEAGDDGTLPGGHDGHRDTSAAADDARRVRVKATSFRFEPGEIRAKASERLAIILTSTDLLHDFTVDELDAHVAADKGETARGGLTAKKPGRYPFYCTVAGHRAAGMEGVLLVE